MTQPLGEEFIAIRPSLAGFRAELNAQLAAALTGVQPQLQGVQQKLRQTAGGVILPTNVRSVTTETERFGQATKATGEQLAVLSTKSRGSSEAVKNLTRDIQHAETAAGRTARGLVAATAASTGFFRAVSFASGAFLVGATLGATLAAGVQEFKAMTVVGAQTAAVIKATGESANVTAGQVDALAQKQLRLTGTDDELIKSAADVLLTFRSIRNEVGAGNQIFTRSVKAVQDISAVFGTDLRGSAVQLGKALQDPVRGVTALRRSGITLSQSQRDLIKRLVETGRLLTAQKIILGEVERQVGGTAEAIGRTLPGRLAIMREEAKNSLGEFVKRVSESRSATQAFTDTTGGLGDAIRTVTSGAAAAGGALLTIGRAVESITHVGDVAQALGGLRTFVKTLGIAAITLGGLKLALALATAAQTAYTSATTVATVATEAEGAAAAAAATRISLGAAALNALKGPLGVAIGITAVTVGFIKLREAMQNAPGTLNATRRALDGLSDAVARSNRLRSDLAGSRENVSLARFDVLAAQRGVNAARGAAARSTAAPGSVEQVALANRVVKAQSELEKANKNLAAAEQRRDAVEQQLANNERSRPFVIANTTKELQKQIDAIGKFTFHSSLFGDVSLPGLNFQTESSNRRLEKFNSLMDNLISKGTPLEQNVARVLRAIRATIGGIPSEKQIALVVKLVGQGGRSIDEILALVGAGRGTEAIRARGLPTQPETFSQQQEDRFLGLKAALKTQTDLLAKVRDTAKTRLQELATQREQVTAAQQALQAAQDQQRSARQALADARQAAVEARQNLRDTIAAGKQAVNDAVTSAKGNLDQLGQAIAQALGQTGQGVAGRFNAGLFGRLRSQILAGGGGPDTQREAQRIATQAQGSQQSATDFQRKFADLTDALNRGKISLPQFNRQFNALVKTIDIKSFRRQFGTAAANVLVDEIKAARKQASLIAGGPQRAGGGTQQTIVRPLDAVAQASRDVAAASRQVGQAVRGINNARRDVQRANSALIEAEQRLRQAQARETKANTLAIAANTRVTQRLHEVEKARLALEGGGGNRPKPKNNAAATNDKLIGAGAGAP